MRNGCSGVLMLAPDKTRGKAAVPRALLEDFLSSDRFWIHPKS
ncbi:rCG53328, partial [Rattus norvegicus]